MSLREIQRGFVAGVLFDDASIHRHIRDRRFGATRHLQIYRNNVYVSLTGALEAIYPVVARLVGPDCFRGCAYGYIRQAPPTSGNLHDFGARFADFLATFEPVCALEYLPDVARLEWAWHCAFHAADAEPLALDALASVPQGRYGELRFALHPSARLQSSAYPLLKIWQANQPDASAEVTIDLREGGVDLLIVRRHLTVEIEQVPAAAYALLRAFAEGCNLTEAAARTAAAASDFDLTATLRHYVQNRTITGFGLDQQGKQEAS